MAENVPKGQIIFFRPTNLKWGQISEIWPKKGQPGNPDQQSLSRYITWQDVCVQKLRWQLEVSL